MSDREYGVTTADAAYFLGVTPSTVRNWLSRYPDLAAVRTRDGQLDWHMLEEWWTFKRDHMQAQRRGNRGLDSKAS